MKLVIFLLGLYSSVSLACTTRNEINIPSGYCVKRMGDIHVNRELANCSISYFLVNMSEGKSESATFTSQYQCAYRQTLDNEHAGMWFGCPFSLGIGCLLALGDIIDQSSSQGRAVSAAVSECVAAKDRILIAACDDFSRVSERTKPRQGRE